MFLMALGLAGGVGLVLGAVIGNPALGMFTLGIITYLGLHRRAWHCNRRSCTERGYCRHV